MAQQLSFDLPTRMALGREDFFVSPSNAVAVQLLLETPWPGNKLILSGDAGSGKTHLTHVWANQSRARVIAADALHDADIPTLAAQPVAVEDVPHIAGDSAAQTALFHLHNLTLANGNPLLMTGQQAPKRWQLSLPDLQSRIEGTQHAFLEPPDDALLLAVLAKLFTDRQLNPKPDVISYLVKHMDRRFDAAAQMVARLDQLALSEKREINRALAIRLVSTDDLNESSGK